jgi:DNA-binding NarL/FixJ family response regulator
MTPRACLPIAHRDPFPRAGLRALLEPGFDIVATAATAVEAVTAAQLVMPGVVVADAAFADGDGASGRPPRAPRPAPRFSRRAHTA